MRRMLASAALCGALAGCGGGGGAGPQAAPPQTKACNGAQVPVDQVCPAPMPITKACNDIQIPVDQACVLNKIPTFGSAVVARQTYTIGLRIDELTVPTAGGGDGDLSYALAPLPDGLSFDGARYVLRGRPTVPGRTSVRYTAMDDDGDVATVYFTILVEDPCDPTVRHPVYACMWSQTPLMYQLLEDIGGLYTDTTSTAYILDAGSNTDAGAHGYQVRSVLDAFTVGPVRPFGDVDTVSAPDTLARDDVSVLNMSVTNTLDASSTITALETYETILVLPAGNVDDEDTDRYLPQQGVRRVQGGETNKVLVVAGSVVRAGATTIHADSLYCGDMARWCVTAPFVIREYVIPDDITGFAFMSGTSFSAPQVAGLVATIQRRWPAYTSTEVVRIVLACADPTPFGGTQEDEPHAEYGHGMLSAACLYDSVGELRTNIDYLSDGMPPADMESL